MAVAARPGGHGTVIAITVYLANRNPLSPAAAWIVSMEAQEWAPVNQ
jgi:hypothetical protein